MNKSRQKIVVLIDWYLPGTKAGGPVRSIYSLVALLKDHFDFYIITSNKDLGSDKAYDNIEPDRLFRKEDVSYYYFSEAHRTESNLHRLISEINPDLIYLNSLWSYDFSIGVVRAKKKGLIKAPLLLAPRGMLSTGAMGLKSLKKNFFLLVAKLAGWYRAIHFHATNEQEKNDIQKQFRNARVSIAPNLNSGSVFHVQKAKKENHLKLFFLSRIAKVKNLHFALEVLTLIKGDLTIEYDIYGNIEDKDYWASCEEIIKTLPPNIKVTYRQELQFNEVQPMISSYHVLFLPTLNENFGHSIVESLLCGCQVLISDQTPWNDVEKAGVGYAISLDNKAGFVDALRKLGALSNDEFAVRNKAAINYISDKLNIQQSVEHYKKLFNDAVQN
ncbi:MAG: glycosyltransferase [Bacteroidetes bacterium]|nr:glycosyltransferase [Bacteroidota bacterium]